ncbi:MAG: hypothetical protein OEY28_10280 [Nitrospira sp.]|nr:hypothetical protein [Nitrospira sp.]
MNLSKFKGLSMLSVALVNVSLFFTVQAVQAQSGTSGTDILLRGMSELSQSMNEMNDCKDRFKNDMNGYYACYQDVNKRNNQRNLQWQMEMQESFEAENQKRKEEEAREICADREDDRAWALCMKRYGGR